MQPMLLDFFARTHTPYLHACGPAGTATLLRILAPRVGERILELGFGTGHTLTLFAGAFPAVTWIGVEHSPLMLEVAGHRLRWSGQKRVILALYDGYLPFPDQYFDAMYCESVLAIVADDKLPGLVKELYRVLRPGGRFCCNESLWLPHVDTPTIQAINARCIEAFGMVQASARYPYPADWAGLFEAAGFTLLFRQALEPGAPTRLPGSAARVLSTLFSRWGWLKTKSSPAWRKQARVWKQQEQGFSQYGKYLEGILWSFQKPGSLEP